MISAAILETVFSFMTTNFFDADAEYRRAVEATGNLDSAFTLACAVRKVDWNGTDLTRAVLARMKSYYTAQRRIKKLLDKHYAAAAADYFVETVAFYLKVAIDIEQLSLRVASEEVVNKQYREFHKQVIKAETLAAALGVDGVKHLFGMEWPEAIDWAKGGVKFEWRIPKDIRADISVWKDGELIAVIECKTQLGRKRGGWLEEFEERAERLRIQRPRTKLFLLAMTEANWGGFDRNDCRFGKQFFALLDGDHGPMRVDPSAATMEGIVHPMESLFRLILER
jgi:hypothetical protein